MGDLATLAKARRELEDLYSGIPDESVNLTFQDLAQLQQHHHHPTTTLERKKSGLNPISEAAAAASSSAASTPKREIKISSSSSSSSSRSALTKLPSLDFNRAFEASNNHQQHNNNRHDKDHYHGNIMNLQDSSGNQHGRHHYHHHRVDDQEELALHDYASQGGKYPYDHHHPGNAHGHHHHPLHGLSGHRADDQRLGFISSSSMGFDDISSHKMSTGPNSFQANAAAAAGAGRRRPGIPHSNICTICSVYIYMFRHRCLVIIHAPFYFIFFCQKKKKKTFY